MAGEGLAREQRNEIDRAAAEERHDLQAVVQAWQPMHEVWSMTQAKLVTAGRTPDDDHR